MIKIERTPVSQNSKCESCLHYDGNAMSKGGACEVGTQPAMCGGGDNPQFGYNDLSVMSPDMLSDLAVPCLTGSPGAMNEHGNMDQAIKMQQVVLGDEHLTIAQRILGEMSGMFKSVYADVQGQTSRFSPHDHAAVPRGGAQPSAFDVAKTLHEQYMRPREQYKFSLKETLMFLGANGFDVSGAEMAKAEADDLAKAAARGPGSRGGQIAYYTKSGNPVYRSQVKKQAPQASKMAEQWTQNAVSDKTADSYATAAKQHLAAAFYQHHAGDSVYAKQHLDFARQHQAQAWAQGAYNPGKPKAGNKAKRTMNWIDKNMKETAKLVGGSAKKALSLYSDVQKAKYTRREGSPGNYKYYYDKPGAKKPSSDEAYDPAEQQAQTETYEALDRMPRGKIHVPDDEVGEKAAFKKFKAQLEHWDDKRKNAKLNQNTRAQADRNYRQLMGLWQQGMYDKERRGKKTSTSAQPAKQEKKKPQAYTEAMPGGKNFWDAVSKPPGSRKSLPRYVDLKKG